MSPAARSLQVFGVYDWQAARAELRRFFFRSVPARLSVPAFFAAFVALGMAPATLLLFGAVGAAGALWTWSALRRN